MAKKTASDLVDKLAVLAEEIQTLTVAETRRDVADMIETWAKPSSRVNPRWADLANEAGRDETWTPSADFIAGMRLAAKLSRTLEVEL